jgi:hypothetical protein
MKNNGKVINNLFVTDNCYQDKLFVVQVVNPARKLALLLVQVKKNNVHQK